jgi:hypothetical protein
MGTVTLQFSSSTAWQSKVIRCMCHSPFSHVDIKLSDGALLGASNQGKDSPHIFGNPCGVAIRPPDYQAFKIRVDATFETPCDIEIHEAAHSQLGKEFDNGALYDFFSDNPFKREWRLRDNWFCSELAAWSFETGGYWHPMREVPWPKGRVSPPDLLGWFMFDDRWVNREEFMAKTREALAVW